MRSRVTAFEPLHVRFVAAIICAQLTFLSFAQSGHAANVNNIAPGEDFVVELPFRANPGDQFMVSYDQSWQNRETGETPSQYQLHSTEHGEILKQRSDGYTVQWTTQDLSVSAGDNPSDIDIFQVKFLQALLADNPNKQIEFIADQSGRPIHVPQWRAINAFRTKVIDEQLPEIVKEVLPKVTKKKNYRSWLANLKALLQDSDSGFTFVDGKSAADGLEAAVLMAGVQNIGLPRIGRFEWKMSAPVLGNEDQTKSTTMVWFESFSRQFDVAEIRWHTKFDKADLRNTRTYKRRLARFQKSEEAKGKVSRLPSIKPEEIRKLADKHLKFERADVGYAKVRISDGWTQEATYEKRSDWSVLGAKSSEIYRLRISVKRLPTN